MADRVDAVLAVAVLLCELAGDDVVAAAVLGALAVEMSEWTSRKKRDGRMETTHVRGDLNCESDPRLL